MGDSVTGTCFQPCLDDKVGRRASFLSVICCVECLFNVFRSAADQACSSRRPVGQGRRPDGQMILLTWLLCLMMAGCVARECQCLTLLLTSPCRRWPAAGDIRRLCTFLFWFTS